tara:strand:+ start:369 stop:539 length:171 start_codon:yes stop_codon:yes gene_type:complete
MLFLLMTYILHGCKFPPEALLEEILRSLRIDEFFIGEDLKALIDFLEITASETLII